MSDELPAKKELKGGRYVLLSTLGRGAQATTWDAVDKREGRSVAIKEFDVRGARAWKDVELAEREARVLSELDHPMLPHYVEHFEEGGALYLVMEKIEGTPLSVTQKSGQPMKEAEVVSLLRDADKVFQYLHGRSPPVIHRDIKPSNIIRRPDGTFAFVDFGAVRDRLRPEGGSTVVGTFGYMAPEQFQGRAGPGSDLYAVGATALAMLTGAEPETLPHKGLAVDVRAALGGKGSQKLVVALSRMLEPDPDRRARQIGPLLAGAGSDPRPQTRTVPPDPRAARSRWDPQRQAEWRAMWDIEPGVRESRRAVRRAQRAARRAARAAARSRRQHAGPSQIPFFVAVLLQILLTAAQVIAAVALQTVVPLFLTLLSLFFGSGLRRAAHEVRLVGGEAQDAIRTARDFLAGRQADELRHSQRAPQESAEDAPRVRVSSSDAPAAGGGVRVAAPADELEDDESEPAVASRRMRRP